jgi:hypothetical protein
MIIQRKICLGGQVARMGAIINPHKTLIGKLQGGDEFRVAGIHVRIILK